MTGWITAAYLAVGAIAAAMFWNAIRHGLDRRSEDRQYADGMDAAERTLNGLPGGMLTFLLLVVLFWPLPLVLFIKRRLGGRG